MTTPLPLIPDWFKNNFVNVEDLVIDMYAKILPAFSSGRWTPDSWLDEAVPDPMLTVIRLPGGHMDIDQGYDECLVQITITTNDPEDSNSAMSVVRATLLPIQALKFKMADDYTALIYGVAEVTGPTMLTMQQQLDVRVIPATFRMRVGLKNRTRYDQIIRSL